MGMPYKLATLLLNDKHYNEAAESFLEVAQTELKLRTYRYPSFPKAALRVFLQILPSDCLQFAQAASARFMA